MSEQRDRESELNGDRHEEISKAYRARSADMPDAALDARILAAAHRAAGSRPRADRRHWFRWIDAPLATAAVVLVSATLIFMMYESREIGLQDVVRDTATSPPALPSSAPLSMERESSAADKASRSESIAEPSPPPATPSPAAPEANGTAIRAADRPQVVPAEQAPAAASLREREQSAAAGPAEDRKAAQRPQAFPAPPARSDAGRQAGTAAPPAAEPESERRSDIDEHEAAEAAAPPDSQVISKEGAAAPRQAAPARAVTGAVAPAPAAKQRAMPQESAAAQTESPRTPQLWLEDIRALVREGKVAEARTALAEFRKVYPAYPLPDDLKDI